MDKYGKLIDGVIQYAPIKNGALITDTNVIFAPSESTFNSSGYYKILSIEEDGTDIIEDNILKHYIGKPKEDVKTYEELTVELIRGKYTVDEEFAIHRHHAQDPENYTDEWNEYIIFVEQCKSTAKEELGL